MRPPKSQRAGRSSRAASRDVALSAPQTSERALRARERVGVDSDPPEEREVEVREGRLLGETEMPPAVEAAARDEDRQLVVVVRVAVADRAPVDDDGAVEER